jgi:hypothetical protein
MEARFVTIETEQIFFNFVYWMDVISDEVGQFFIDAVNFFAKHGKFLVLEKVLGTAPKRLYE